MELRFFWDTYAVIEFINGNPKFSRFSEEPVVITIFNLAEIYWVALREYDESVAEEIYETYKQSIVEIDDDTMKKAIKFRKSVHKESKISYADAIGYMYAKNNNILFLTGDKEFEFIDNVEFVKK